MALRCESKPLKLVPEPMTVQPSMIMYDGETRVAEHTGLDLRVDHSNDRFEVVGNPEIGKGINIAFGIRFDLPRTFEADRGYRCRLGVFGLDQWDPKHMGIREVFAVEIARTDTLLQEFY